MIGQYFLFLFLFVNFTLTAQWKQSAGLGAGLSFYREEIGEVSNSTSLNYGQKLQSTYLYYNIQLAKLPIILATSLSLSKRESTLQEGTDFHFPKISTLGPNPYRDYRLNSQKENNLDLNIGILYQNEKRFSPIIGMSIGLGNSVRANLSYYDKYNYWHLDSANIIRHDSSTTTNTVSKNYNKLASSFSRMLVIGFSLQLSDYLTMIHYQRFVLEKSDILGYDGFSYNLQLGLIYTISSKARREKGELR